MTKKTSTPVKPPGRRVGKAWNTSTEHTAMARRPSMSGRYWMLCALRTDLPAFQLTLLHRERTPRSPPVAGESCGWSLVLYRHARCRSGVPEWFEFTPSPRRVAGLPGASRGTARSRSWTRGAAPSSIAAKRERAALQVGTPPGERAVLDRQRERGPACSSFQSGHPAAGQPTFLTGRIVVSARDSSLEHPRSALPTTAPRSHGGRAGSPRRPVPVVRTREGPGTGTLG